MNCQNPINRAWNAGLELSEAIPFLARRNDIPERTVKSHWATLEKKYKGASIPVHQLWDIHARKRTEYCPMSASHNGITGAGKQLREMLANQ